MLPVLDYHREYASASCIGLSGSMLVLPVLDYQGVC